MMQTTVEDELSERLVLMLARKRGETYLLKDLLTSHPAYKNTKDATGNCLLATACWNGSIEVAKLLVEEFDFDVNFRNQKGSTPLHQACARNHQDLIMFLVSRGANINISNQQQRVPLDYADSLTRKILEDKMHIDNEIIKKQLNDFRKKDIAWDEAIRQRRKMVTVRCKKAVDIRICNAINEYVNGVFSPIWMSCGDWPVYAKVSDENVKLKFDELNCRWLVRSPAGTVVQLQCSIPNYPELRFEGSNGITEFVDVNGGGDKVEVENRELSVSTELVVIANTVLKWQGWSTPEAFFLTPEQVAATKKTESTGSLCRLFASLQRKPTK